MEKESAKMIKLRDLLRTIDFFVYMNRYTHLKVLNGHYNTALEALYEKEKRLRKSMTELELERV